MPSISSRIDQLKNAGILDDPNKMDPEAQALLEGITDDEFHAILTVHAKISDPVRRQQYRENVIKFVSF